MRSTTRAATPTLPYTFRRISRDHALTEIYSYIVEEISYEPGWHALYFGLSDEQARENAQATTFMNSLLFRRYTAKLHYELDFWSRFASDGGTPEGYAERLTQATGCATAPRTTSPTWTRASTRPTTCARGSGTRSCTST